MEPLVVHPSLSSPRLVRVNGPFSPDHSNRSPSSRVVSLALPIHLFVMLTLSVLCAIVATQAGKKRRVSLVHGQDLAFAGLASVAVGYLLDVPVVLHSHGPHIYLIADRSALFRGLETLINKLVIRAADIVVVTDPLSQSYLEGIGVQVGRIVKLPNASFIPIQRPTRKRSDFRVASIGRISPKKNLGVLLRAFQMACDTIGESARLLIVGDGPCLGHLKALARQLRIEDKTVFLGPRWDVLYILSEVDVFVLPSLIEGSPLSVLEAMAAGVPMIASDIPSVREIISHDINGVLVPPKSVEGFARAITMVYKDPAKAEALSQAAREHIERFHDPEVVFPKLLEVYRRAVKARALRHPP